MPGGRAARGKHNEQHPDTPSDPLRPLVPCGCRGGAGVDHRPASERQSAHFQELACKVLHPAVVGGGLFELDASTLGFTDGQTYHYWFEVDDTSPGATGRVQTTDPLAFVVDYRLYAPKNPSVVHPASVIGFSGGGLVARDPNGEAPQRSVADFDRLAQNNRIVIYELPRPLNPPLLTVWSR